MRRNIYTQPILINGERFYPQSINWQRDKVEMEIIKVRDFNFKSIKCESSVGGFNSDRLTITEKKYCGYVLYHINCENVTEYTENKLNLPYSRLTVEGDKLICLKDNVKFGL